MNLCRIRNLPLIAGALLLAASGFAQQNELNWSMERAIKQLDHQGEDFESMLAEADVEWKAQDGSSRSMQGRIFMNKDGEFRLTEKSPKTGTVMLHRKTFYDYDPATSVVKEYSLSKHKNRLEPYVRLGFSSTGKDLQKDFLVSFIGEKEISGRRALGLELTPKKDSLRAVISKIELWVDEASWLPARQVISQAAGGETMTITYTGMAKNLSLNPDLFKVDWPKGTDRQRQ